MSRLPTASDALSPPVDPDAGAELADDGGSLTVPCDRSPAFGSGDASRRRLAAGSLSGAEQPVRSAVFGRYRIESKVAVGGMGVVFRAYDPMLERTVALKVVRPSLGGEFAQRLLFREAQALARVRHPNVVAIHDVGVLGRDVFVAMEFVPGQTFHAWLEQRERSTEEILKVARAAGAGLAAAHRAGLVHRDFKRSNVIVGDDGRVQVIDFGLARPSELALHGDEQEPHDRREIGAEQDGESRTPTGHLPSDLAAEVTEAWGCVGTEMYMSPEQHRGEALDHRSDQFSFCVTLYIALSGAHPFGLDTAGRVPATTVLDGARAAPRSESAGSDSVHRAIERGVAPSRARVPAWIHKVLQRGLSANPRDRYPSMEVLLSDLGRDPSRAMRWWNATALAAVAALVFASGWLRAVDSAGKTQCAAPERWLGEVWDEPVRASVRNAFATSGVAHAVSTGERVEGIFDDYASQWTDVYRQACEATHVRGKQSDEMLDLRMRCLERSNNRVVAFIRRIESDPDRGLVDNAVTAAREVTSLARCSDQSTLRAQQAYPDLATPEDRERLRQLQAQIDELGVMVAAGQYRQVVAQGESVVVEADALGYAPAQAELLFTMGTALYRSGRGEEGAEALGRGQVLAARAGDHDLEALLIAKRIWVLGNVLDRYAAALALVAPAEAAAIRAGDTARVREAVLGSIGVVYYSKADYDLAEEFWRRRVELLESTADPSDPALGWAFNNLGALSLRQERYEQASQQLERARSVWNAALGPDHPALAILSTNLGIAYKETGQLDRALDAHQRALAAFTRAHGPDHAHVATTLINLGEVFRARGDLAEAETLFRRALAIQQRQTDPATKTTAFAYAQVGHVLNQRGKNTEAVELLERAIEIYESTVGLEDPFAGEAFRGLGRVRIARGEVEAGVTALERALAVLSARGAATVPSVQLELADALWDARLDRRRARELATAARDAYAARADDADAVRTAEDWLRGHRAP